MEKQKDMNVFRTLTADVESPLINLDVTLSIYIL